MPFKYYIIYMKPLYRQNRHYIGKSTTSRLTYQLVTKSVPCRLDSTYRLENLGTRYVYIRQGYTGGLGPWAICLLEVLCY
jgi:hypothetical protein